MRTRRSDNFTAITVEGQILPADLLQRIVEKDSELGGLTPDSYHLSPGETVNEATSRAWNRLTANWSNFNNARAQLPTNDPGTTITRDRWLLPLLQELGYGRLPATRAAVTIDGKSYAISHWWANVPIHLVGCGVSLDRLSARVAGAARSSPHSLTQELLNRSEDSLWGLVSNGLQLRILRDNQNLVRQAFVEFDLEAMMDGEAYSDFVMLWLLCHQSRVETVNSTNCWLERWSRAAQERGVRALEHLREGVEQAISLLGSGFLAHRANVHLRDKLRLGTLDKQDYYRQLLRLVYRLLFLFVAEDRTDERGRSLLFDPKASQEACDLYTKFYSTKRLRQLAERRHGSRHSDLYAGVQLVMEKLSSDGCGELALPALGSFLFSQNAIADLNEGQIANHDLLDAVRALAFTTENQARRQIDYKNLGSEELGSVYESLLELHPQLNIDAATFALSTAAGHERKTTGSYYTPDSLVQCLLDSALDPVIDQHLTDYGRLGYKSPEESILNLKICDPACGSGHFLIAAAHRLAKRVAALETGTGEPSPDAVRHALRKVVSHCLYGVDVNPMAVELCKVSLWMEALEPGKPLSFLDHHIRCGNSLLGSTPLLICEGIPDEAFRPMEGDDRRACATLKKRNTLERRGFGDLFIEQDNAIRERLRLAASVIDDIGDDRPEDVHRKEAAFKAAEQDNYFRKAKALADLWCAAFVITKSFHPQSSVPVGITTQHLRDLAAGGPVDGVFQEATRLAERFGFFHWHIAYPEVFEKGGFNVFLGNPPWIRHELFKPIKNLLSVYSSFKSTADMSVFFIELSVKLITAAGRSALLTPNKWFRAAYGASLRRYLRGTAKLHLVIDFGHSKTLFKDADTFPACVVFSPVVVSVSDETTLRFVRAFDDDRRIHTLQELVADHYCEVRYRSLSEAGWVFNEPEVDAILNTMRSGGLTLAQSIGGPPLYGLKTGFNEAFYVSDELAEQVMMDEPQSALFVRPFIRGRDVKRWRVRWEKQWHIVIPSSQNRDWLWTKAADEDDAESIFAETHPVLHQHLKQFEPQLRNRTDKGKYWWELRSCDYYERFTEPKIVVSRISFHSACGLDLVGYFQNDSTVAIPTSDPFVLAVLNSRVGWWYMTLNFPHKKDEAISMDAEYLGRFPIPNVSEEAKARIRRTCQKLIDSASILRIEDLLSTERELSTLIWQAYGLAATDEQILDRFPALRDPLHVISRDMERRPASVPLLMPSSTRYPQPDPGIYMLRVILSMLDQSGGVIAVERLMDACSLLSAPDLLEMYSSRTEPLVAHDWRRGFSDQFRPELFLPKLDELVQRGEIRLIAEDGGFKVIRMGTSELPTDDHIEFDARFALRVGDSLIQAEKKSFTPLATQEQIEKRSRAA